MRNSETGEFEIAIGNKQLLSTFFVIVLLCGAAFVMGYVLGENSRSSKTSAELGGTPPVAVTGSNEARPQPASPPPPPAPATDTDPNAEKPAQTAAAQEPPSTTAPAETSPEPTTQPSRELQKEAAAAQPQAAAAPSGPPAYWQVIATSNAAAAQDLVQALKEKGMPARTSPGRNNLIRVLVGPYSDKTSFAKAKLAIEGAGFGTPVVAK